MSRQIEQSADSQRLVGDMLVEKIAGDKPASFDALYDKTYKAREAAEHHLNIQRTINETLASENKELKTLTDKLASSNETLKKERDRAEKDAKDAPKLREENARLETTSQRQKEKLDEMTPFFENPDGKKALAAQEELVRTRYAAIGGWGCSALLCAGLVALYLYFKPLADDAAASGDRPSHRIE